MMLVDPSNQTAPFVTPACILEQVVELLCKKDWDEQTPLGKVIRHGNIGMCEVMLRRVEDYLGHKTV